MGVLALIATWFAAVWGVAVWVAWQTYRQEQNQLRHTRFSLNQHYQKSGLPTDKWVAGR